MFLLTINFYPLFSLILKYYIFHLHSLKFTMNILQFYVDIEGIFPNPLQLDYIYIFIEVCVILVYSMKNSCLEIVNI